MEIREILGKVRAGEMSVEDAIIQMRLEPFEDLGYARVDHHRALRQGVASEMARLERSLSLLATAANTAPFIGLFGTVWGIMHSFHSIGMLKSASLATVAPGISEALVATAIGLGVAVPATIGFNIFMGKLSQVDTLLVNFAGVFLNRVQRELNAHRPVQRTGATEM